MDWNSSFNLNGNSKDTINGTSGQSSTGEVEADYHPADSAYGFINESNYNYKNYGLIKANENLENLEVMVLELSPPEDSPINYDIMKKYWSNWLSEMGVKKFDIIKTDQPVYTEKRIRDFLSK